MMLQGFSWQDFLLAAVILSVVWYAGVGLLFYRAEISAFFSGGSVRDGLGASEPLAHSWQDKVDELQLDLMGEAAGEPGVSVLEAEDFSFVPREKADRAADPLGDLADVQQEIKGVCGVLKSEDGTKEDFFELFALVKQKYPRVFADGLRPELLELVVDNLPFSLSDSELAGL